MLKPKKLKEFRIQRGITTVEVAKALNIDTSHWHRIESSNNWFPNMKTMVKIAKFFDISLDDLVRLMGYDIPHKKIIIKNDNEVVLEMTDYDLCYRKPYTAEVYYYDDNSVYENTRVDVKKIKKAQLNEDKQQ